MKKRCSTCGQQYPPSYITCTCSLCGGLIENENITPHNLHKNWQYKVQWEEWQKKLAAAPPRPMRHEDWLLACQEFNTCALCKATTELEPLLIVPTYLGGKLYTYNVVPTCSSCAQQYRRKVIANPFKTLYTTRLAPKEYVDFIFAYFDSILLDATLETFDYEEDTLEITVVVTEDTSCLPFNGIYARRKFDDKPLFVQYYNKVVPLVKMEEVSGISWRLL